MAEQIADVTDTAAYRAIVPMIRREDRERFRRAMQVMFERGAPVPGFPFFGARDGCEPHRVLIQAFYWGTLDGKHLPEISNFWHALYSGLRHAKEARHG